MKYHAKLNIGRIPTDHNDLKGLWLSGYIYDDKHTHGLHPFNDGEYVYTTTVTRVVKRRGKVYVTTKNTTYLLISEPA
ncbi:hypothetical protein Arno162_129 [Pectobacterium phage Arno162]|uniref:Uncharacterized protein n=1 Tax=Pectobacterium phage Arno162 TaxID=2500577 RepID=A0A678ZMI4_9CAUD|nr:hypothetical protein Arno162_129 [Pectobacterium phage Arno162]